MEHRLWGRVWLLMRGRAGRVVGDVLDEGADERYVQELLPAADAEHGLVGARGAASDGELEGGAAVLGGHGRVPRGRAEQRRIDIEGAAGDDEPVDEGEIGVRLPRPVRPQGGEPTRTRAP